MECVKLTDFKKYRELYPGTSLTDTMELSKSGTYDEIKMIHQYFNRPSTLEIYALLAERRFTRWYAKNQKTIKRLAILTPAFVIGVHIVSNTLTAILGWDSVSCAGGSVETSFFGGKGSILLHMLVAGFFTLVVSSFLKFTGRGDLIPLVAFVGGGIILYEVIGLFNDIYMGIKGLMKM